MPNMNAMVLNPSATDASYACSDADARLYEIQTDLSKMLRDPLPTRSALFNTSPEGDTVGLAEQHERVAYLKMYMGADWAFIAHGIDNDVLAQQLRGNYTRFIPFAHLFEDRVVFHSWSKVRAAIVREKGKSIRISTRSGLNATWILTRASAWFRRMNSGRNSYVRSCCSNNPGSRTSA